MPAVIQTNNGPTTSESMLNLSVDMGEADTEVIEAMTVTPTAEWPMVDENGWPVGFFEAVAGSMPDLQRFPQDMAEVRDSLACHAC